MDSNEQLKFLQYIASKNIIFADCVNLEKDTFDEAVEKINGLSALDNHFTRIIQKEFPDFGR